MEKREMREVDKDTLPLRRVVRVEYNGVYTLGEDNPPELGRVVYGP